MGVLTNLRKIATAAAMAALMSGTAVADIRAFNEAMQAKDYKKAAVEATSTWATLDKSRSDLPIIANEFGFAALMALDYESARTFATAALAGNGDREFRIGAEVLLRFAEFKLTRSGTTREKLLTALEASATLPGIDLATFLGINALVTYDVESDSWRAARVSAALGEALTGRGKSKPSVENLTFGLIRASSAYAIDLDMESFKGLVALYGEVLDAIQTAPSDEEAKKFGPLLWQTLAWQQSARAQLRSNKDFRRGEPDGSDAWPKGVLTSRIGFSDLPPNACKLAPPVVSRPVAYPSDAADMGIAGAVVVKVDVDEAGAVSNMQMLAAVPQRLFGDAVLKAADRISFTKAPDATPGCTLVRKDKVFTYVFEMRH